MISEQAIVDFLPLLLIFLIAFSIGLIIVLLPFFSAKKRNYFAKNSQYECGFKSIGDIRERFNVKFYLLAILFIVFDIEIAFLFPWAVTVREIGLSGFFSIGIFLLLLTVGFAYEWKKGALDF